MESLEGLAVGEPSSLTVDLVNGLAKAEIKSHTVGFHLHTA